MLELIDYDNPPNGTQNPTVESFREVAIYELAVRRGIHRLAVKQGQDPLKAENLRKDDIPSPHVDLVKDCWDIRGVIYLYGVWIRDRQLISHPISELTPSAYRRLGMEFSVAGSRLRNFVAATGQRYADAPPVLDNIVDVLNRLLVSRNQNWESLGRELLLLGEQLEADIKRAEQNQRREKAARETDDQQWEQIKIRDLAERYECSYQTIYNWADGKTQPPSSVQIRRTARRGCFQIRLQKTPNEFK